MTNYFERPMNRRGFLGAAAATGVVLLTGCSGDGSPTSTSPTELPPNSQRKRGGTLRFGSSQMSGTTSADIQSSLCDFLVARSFTNTLVERDHEFGLRNGLAEVFEPDGRDMQTWTIRIRDGVEFHNGKTLTADDVIFTIRRNIDPKAPGFTSGTMQAIDPNGMKKLDDRTVQLRLKYPNSQLRDGFAEIPSGILPVDFDPQNPIGTGAFKQASLTPSQRWVGVRNENYWKDNMPFLDGVELLGFSDLNARNNAIVSGQIDAMDAVPHSQVEQIRSGGSVNVVISDTGSFTFTGMDVGSGMPLQDPLVREAFRYMVDREQLVDSVYLGQGGVGNDTGTWPQYDAGYPDDLPQYEQDLDRAKALLKKAGKEDLSISLRTAELTPGMVSSATIMADQAREAGVNITIDEVKDTANFYTSEAYLSAALQTESNYTQTMYLNISYLLLPNSSFNSFSHDNSKLNSLYEQALKVEGAEYADIMGEAARLVHDDGPLLVWGRENIPDALSTKFIGLVPDAAGMGFNGYYLEEVSLA